MSDKGSRHLRIVGLTVAGLVLLGLAGISVWQGLMSAKADADTLRARWLVSQWRANTGPVFSPALWHQTTSDLRAGLVLTPDNAQLLDDMGFLYAGRAIGLGTPEVNSEAYTQQQTLFTNAIESYRAATLVRPTFPYTWAYLAQTKELKGEIDAELWKAFDTAVRYGRNEPGVQMSVARVAFAHWETLDTKRKGQITSMIEDARPGPRKDLYDVGEGYGVVLLNM